MNPEEQREKAVLPYPFEILNLAGLFCAVLTLRFSGFQVTWNTFVFTVREAVPAFATFFAVGLLLQCLARVILRRSLLGYLKEVFTLHWMILWFRLLLASVLIMYSYMWLKLAIPLINHRVWDDQFWNLDITIHGGFSPSILLTELFRGTPLLTATDHWYSWWLKITLASQGFFCAHENAVVRKRFGFSQIMLWTLGVWIYIGWPALGPIYAFKHEWAPVSGAMPRNEYTQDVLLDNYNRVIESRTTGMIRAPFNPTYSIAAMPSLHVGILWLFFLWARKTGRWLAYFYLAATVLTLIGSVVTGWHYAVDGYVGIMIAQLSYWAALLMHKKADAGNATAAEPAGAGQASSPEAVEAGAS